MDQLKLGTRDNRTEFRPGDEIAGAAGWQLAEQPRSVEVRLFWFTRGKGTEDMTVADTVRFENPQPEEARPFRFTAPDEPYSFSGRLISLIWALELVIEPGPQSARVNLTISATGKEVLLNNESAR